MGLHGRALSSKHTIHGHGAFQHILVSFLARASRHYVWRYIFSTPMDIGSRHIALPILHVFLEQRCSLRKVAYAL